MKAYADRKEFCIKNVFINIFDDVLNKGVNMYVMFIKLDQIVTESNVRRNFVFAEQYENIGKNTYVKFDRK